MYVRETKLLSINYTDRSYFINGSKSKKRIEECRRIRVVLVKSQLINYDNGRVNDFFLYRTSYIIERIMKVLDNVSASDLRTEASRIIARRAGAMTRHLMPNKSRK